MKRIKNFEHYIITKEGKIYNTSTGKEVSGWVDNVGYIQICLHNCNKKKYKRLHRLVAETFIPNPDNLPQVNHIDGNKLNNCVDNLEWISNRNNTQHGYDSKLYKSTYRCPIEVYDTNGNFIREFPSIRNLSEVLGLNRKTVTSILKGVKTTNNYNYIFKYKQNSQETIQSIS